MRAETSKSVCGSRPAARATSRKRRTLRACEGDLGDDGDHARIIGFRDVDVRKHGNRLRASILEEFDGFQIKASGKAEEPP